MNELYQNIYGADDEISSPLEWLIAIFHQGVCMGEYPQCQEMTAEEAYEYGLNCVEDLIEANGDSPYNYQVYIRPATLGDLEA